MDIDDEKIRHAVKQTEILRAPKQSLYTFGTTNIYYYLVTEPAYSEIIPGTAETVVREGRVVAQKPQIVTPFYLSRLEGFSSEAKKYFEALVREFGANMPGLLYTYKNEPKELNVVSNKLLEVVDKLNADIDKRGDPLVAIIKGPDELWDVSLLKFIHELTRGSLQDNLTQLGNRGLLNVDTAGIPAEARMRIDELFKMVEKGEREPKELKDELERWGVFEEYQDRFFTLFARKG
ncbi:MAG: hypothetical protein HY665_04135 [Chloroflexi bacterium]|nr:hypothetical protein [Chloroflexota bacterium]